LIDIHSHVLFGLDDGAKTIEESVAMLRMAADNGTTDLVATPHANQEYSFDPGLIAERRQQLEAAAGGAVRLYTGCDFHLSYDNIQDALAQPRKYTINHQCYLLVEFSDLLIFKNTGEIFGRLADAGMIPIVTHPERNGLLRQRVDEIARWVDQGAYVQVTAQSLTGRFGRRARDFARVLLDRRLVHIIASDAHDCESRPPVLREARQWLCEYYGEALADTLTTGNPGATLTGESLELPAAAVGSTSRKWYQIWR
jgi:protein-tyrosine phosphatase